MGKTINEQISYYRHLLSIIPGHIYWKDAEGKYLGCNLQQALDLGLSSPEEIIGKTDYDLSSKPLADIYRRCDQKVMKEGKSCSFEEPGNNDDGVTFISQKAPLIDENGNISGVIGISCNISTSKKEYQHLFSQKEIAELMLNYVIENMPGHVYWKNEKGVFLGSNRRQAQTLGFQHPRELVGKTAYDTTTTEEADELTKTDKEVMRANKTITKEEPFIAQDGNKIVFLSNKVPLKNKQGKTIGILGISFDITERKKLEEELAKTKIEEAHFKAMSALGGMIAHELKTPLMSIGLSASSIKDFFPILVECYREYVKLTGNARIREGYLESLPKLAEDIGQSARYASNTIEAILAGFHYSAAQQTIPVTKIEINAVIQEALENYPMSSNEKLLVAFHPQKNLTVLGDSRIITHVLHNLLKNALYMIKAVNKGEISVATQKLNDDSVQIFFQDTAKGISKEVQAHLFEPFYTTKSDKSSVGLGLYFAKMALEKIGASITCESEEGRYARFIITLQATTE